MMKKLSIILVIAILLLSVFTAFTAHASWFDDFKNWINPPSVTLGGPTSTIVQNLFIKDISSSGNPCLRISTTGLVSTTTCGGAGGLATSTAWSEGLVPVIDGDGNLYGFVALFYTSSTGELTIPTSTVTRLRINSETFTDLTGNALSVVAGALGLSTTSLGTGAFTNDANFITPSTTRLSVSNDLDVTDDIFQPDSARHYFGTGNDAAIFYDSSLGDLIIDPREVGTGELRIGTGAAGVDYQIRFDGETNDALIDFNEDFGSIIVRNPIDANVTHVSATSSFTLRGIAVNSQTATTTDLSPNGVTTQCSWIANTAKRGDCIGGLFFARNGTANVTSTAGGTELVGGNFTSDNAGVSSSSIANALGGRFNARLNQGSDNNITTATGFEVRTWGIDSSGVRNTIGTLNGGKVFSPSKSAGGKLTTVNGLLFQNISSVVASGTIQVINIETQTAADAGNSNIYFAGGDMLSGHLQLNTGHIWNDAASSSLKFYSTIPTSATSSSNFAIKGTTTSTVQIGNVGSPGCIKIRDDDDLGWSYCTILNGTLTCGTGSCE